MRQLIALGLIACLLSSAMGTKHFDDQEDSHSAFKQVHHKQTLQDEPSYKRLEQIQDHPLGAKILQTIALQLKGNDNLEGVSKLLNDLRTDLEAKQIDADLEKTSILGQCKTDLSNYNQRVSLAINEVKDSGFKGKRLNEAIEVYSEEIEEKSRQIEVMQDKDDTLRVTRLQDSLDYASRTAQMKEMVQAFEVILPKLHLVYDAALSAKNEFIEEDQVTLALVELAKIGSENPITSMVALTSTLEPVSVQTLIEKMEDIRDSVAESINVEDDGEAKHNRDNQVILGAIFSAIENLTREKSGDEEALEETIRNRDIQDKRQRDSNAELTAAKNGNDQRRSQCEQFQVSYEENTIERQKQIAIIKEVQNIIATKIEVVTSFVEQNNLF